MDDSLPTKTTALIEEGQQISVTTSSKKRRRPKGELQDESPGAAVPSKPTSSFREAHKRRQYLIPEEVRDAPLGLFRGAVEARLLILPFLIRGIVC